MKKYQLQAPLFFVGQEVNFIHHNGNLMVGEIVCIETHYSTKYEEENPRGYHIYAITTPTSKGRSFWIGQDSIRNVI